MAVQDGGIKNISSMDIAVCRVMNALQSFFESRAIHQGEPSVWIGPFWYTVRSHEDKQECRAHIVVRVPAWNTNTYILFQLFEGLVRSNEWTLSGGLTIATGVRRVIYRVDDIQMPDKIAEVVSVHPDYAHAQRFVASELMGERS